jgi:recombination protein RecA
MASDTLLARLPADFLQRAKSNGVSIGDQNLGLGLGEGRPAASEVLSFGLGALAPELSLLRGEVNELCVARSGGLGTCLALNACAEAQRQGLGLATDEAQWCAFVDPTASLYAPGVAAQQVALDRLLVVRPPVESLARVALRLARSKVFVLVVVDTTGPLGHSIAVDLGGWVRIVRQMTLALEGSRACVLLITNELARRPLALPVARRIEINRAKPDVLRFRIARDRFHQPEPWRTLPYVASRFEEAMRHAG